VWAFETIVFIEAMFGTELRDYAIRISRERYVLRQKATLADFHSESDAE